MDIEKYYMLKIIETDSFEPELEYRRINQKLNDFKDKFKNINMFRRFTYEQPPKYYLQNKAKKNTSDIQEGLREEIEKLNHIYNDNKYYLDINKSILNKKENKHVYNVFNISILEYRKVNLYNDIILESDSFYYGELRPITLSNINNDLLNILFDVIDDTINLSQLYVDFDDKNDIYYHNRYLEYLKDTIFEFFIDLFSDKNKDVIKIKKLLTKLDPHITSSLNIPLQETLDKYYGKTHFDSDIEEIIDLIIKQGWNLDIGLLNDELMTNIYNENKTSKI